MCGFVGIVDFSEKSLNNFPLEEMTNSISHRGPDDYGYFNNEYVRFGFRRLSIIDIDYGHQPMHSNDKRYVVVFNGEIYNFKKIKSFLESKEYKFTTSCDTEVILYAYDFWGEECVNEFNGMFAFAIYDKIEKSVFLARDRLGIKPLYYTKIDNTIIFSSEIKAILRYPSFKRAADLKSISSYLTFRYTYGDRTFFEGINKLMPGHTMLLKNEIHTIKSYWSIPYHDHKENFGENYYLNEVKNLLNKSVSKRLISDVPLGALLSGGLDSSIITSIMSKESENQVSSYSIGFDKEGYDESNFANLVANHCSTKHLHINLTKDDYISELRKTIIQKDAPLSIPHEIALKKICEVLKEYTTVIISGEGADELFGGYGRVQRSPHDYKKIRFVKKYIPNFAQNFIFKILGSDDQHENWKSAGSKLDYFFSVYNWMSFKEKWSLFTEDVMREIGNDKELINFWEKDFKHTDNGNEYDQILYMFQKNHLICLLDRLDSMSMSAGVEARVPFVDHELVEFVTKIPINYKLKWKSFGSKLLALFSNAFSFSEKLDLTKYLLRKIGFDILPPSIPKRKKKGFPVPLDDWINNGMIEYAKEILLSDKTIKRKIFRKDELLKLINNDQKLDYDFWGKKIWMLINVEIWFREFIDVEK